MNANQQYHEENMRKANAQVFNTYNEAKMRDYNKLKNYYPPRLIGKQRGITMFYTNPQKNCDCDGVSGSGNITYSARMNSDEYEKYRKETLQRRVDSLQAMKEEGAPVPPMVELSPEEGAKFETDAILETILGLIVSDGYVVFNMIYKFIKLLINNIYFYDTNDFTKMLNILDNFTNLLRTQIKINDVKDDDEDNNIIRDDIETFNNIKSYVRENMKGQYLDVNKRKMLSKATISFLKLNNIEKALRRNARGRQMLKEAKDEDDKEKKAKAAAAAAAAAPAASSSSSSSMFPPAPAPAPAPIPLLQPPPPPSGKRPALPSTRKEAYRMLVNQKALIAGITDQQDLKNIEKVAMDYLKKNNKTLTNAEIDALVASYASGIAMGP